MSVGIAGSRFTAFEVLKLAVDCVFIAFGIVITISGSHAVQVIFRKPDETSPAPSECVRAK